ncbi:MAG: response regulator [Thermoanaerobaculia bacterium]|nr:response regulator [Thermoanaerobaculia bacterium]
MNPWRASTILVVDDDPFQRKVLRAWLSAAGWPVLEAGTVDQALREIGGVRLALVDLRLGDEDGLEVARHIATLPIGTRPSLVAMSSDMSESVRARCREVGFAHTMAKPFQRENVLRVVRRLAGDDREANASGATLDDVPASLRDVPALAALWRMEQSSSEPELVPAVEGLRQAGRILSAAARDGDLDVARTVADAAHGLAGAAGILGCTRVEVTSKALASRVRREGVDDQTRLLVSVIENEVQTAVESLLQKIESARGNRLPVAS